MPLIDVFEKINSEYYQLTSAEKKVADYAVIHQQQTQFDSHIAIRPSRYKRSFFFALLRCSLTQRSIKVKKNFSFFSNAKKPRKANHFTRLYEGGQIRLSFVCPAEIIQQQPARLPYARAVRGCEQPCRNVHAGSRAWHDARRRGA